MNDKRIKSIKFKDNRIEIVVLETWGEGNEREWSLRCLEEPDPALPKSVEKLTPEVKSLLDLPSTWAKDAMRVMKISWSNSESTGVEGATMTCRVELECANSPLIFNTPHLPFEQYSPTGNQPTMPDKLQRLLEAVRGHAMAYADGKRAQISLLETAQ